MKKLRDMSRQEKMNVPSTPTIQSSPNGFGNGFESSISNKEEFDNPFV